MNGSYTEEFFQLLGELEVAVGDINYSTDPGDVHWQTRRSAILQRIRFLHKMSAAEVVRERDEFMRVLRELLGLNDPVMVLDLKNSIIGAVRVLISDRRRLLIELEGALKITTADDIPARSRVRIILAQIESIFLMAQRKSFEAYQERSFDWFLVEVERAVGAEQRENDDHPTRMDRVLRLLAELVDRP